MLHIDSKNIRFLSRMGAQGTYGQAIFDMAEDKKNFYVASADLGVASGLNRVIKKYSDKFVNVGIAEQSLVSVAAGMADVDSPVYVSSWAPFVTYRCADQIRIFAGMMKKNIKFIGLASGMHIPKFGATHYGLGDISVVRSIPNITIVSPSDGLEIYKLVYESQKYDGPMYIRLTGGDMIPIINEENCDNIEIGKAHILKEGCDVVIIGCGSILFQAIKAAEKLDEIGISCAVVNMHTIRPLDTKCIDNYSEHKLIVSLEEHSIMGGLGSAVAEYLAKKDRHTKLVMIGVDDFFPMPGEYDYLLEQTRLNWKYIYNKIKLEVGSLR